MVVVILSSRPWGSTKIKLSKEVFMVNSLTYRKKFTSGIIPVPMIRHRGTVVVNERIIRHRMELAACSTNTEHYESQPFEWVDSQPNGVRVWNTEERVFLSVNF